MERQLGNRKRSPFWEQRHREGFIQYGAAVNFHAGNSPICIMRVTSNKKLQNLFNIAFGFIFFGSIAESWTLAMRADSRICESAGADGKVWRSVSARLL
jgi:hypothetical protein